MRVGTIPVGVSRPELGLIQGAEVLAGPGRGPALGAAVAWLREEQWEGLGVAVVSPADLRRWVDEPLDVLAGAIRGRRARAGLAVLRRRLTHELAGATVVVADQHGELALGRWWFTPEAELGVVDGWHPVGRNLAEVDTVRLLLAARALDEDADPGLVSRTFADLLDGGWTEDEAAALGPGWANNPRLRLSTIVLLAWLQGLATGEVDGPVPSTLDERRRNQERKDARALLERFAPGTDLVVDEALLEVAPPPAEPRPIRSAESRSAGAVVAAARRAADRATSRRDGRRTVAMVTLGSLLWLAGTYHLDPSTMGDLGLLSILRPAAYAGLAVLVACLALELVSPKPATWRLAAPLVAVVAAVHGTPSWLYGTLRYSWAWKHLGILDYIHRHGAVHPGIGALDVYHGWPGFFAVNSALTDLFGLPSAVQYARWWPVLANLAVIPALLFAYRGLRGGDDRRLAWAATVIFVASNWIGQDYFSPQSMAFLLYLVIVGVVLRLARPEDLAPSTRRWLVAVALLAAAAIVTSHQVTPMVLVASLVALALVRRAHTAKLVGTVAVMLALWAATGAREFVVSNGKSLLDGFGEPVSNANGNLVDQGTLSQAQVAVSMMGRVTILVVALLALVGGIQQLRRRELDRAAVALVLAPATLLFASSFGGEIGFRAYLFALPFLAWFAAQALLGAAGRLATASTARRARRSVAFAVAVTVLLTGTLFGYLGKDRWYRFTSGEVAASEYVLTDAKDPSLLVTLTANYPGQWKDYERLVYVPITQEPASSQKRILRDPAEVLADWLSSSKYKRGYVLLTRSQEAEIEAQGVLPHGQVARMRRALERSPLFRETFTSPDAQVFELVGT